MEWLSKRLHPMWHAAALCYGILGGVALAQWWSGVSWWLAIAAIPLIGLAFWQQRRILLILALGGGLLIGLARGSSDQTQLKLYEPLYGQSVQITGTVRDDADYVTSGTKLQIAGIKMGGKSLPGQIWLSLRSNPSIKRGDELTLRGILKPGFGNFAAVLAKAKLDGIKRTAGSDSALELRDTFANGVHRAINDPGASLGIGFLLGKKSMLPENLLEALKITGLTHIIVASGYNLTILVRLARRLFSRMSKYSATFASFVLILGFIAMTGASPSMVRAGLVTGLSLLAWYVGRKFHPVVLLGLVSAMTVLWNPNYAWGDMGWMLSFAAFAGVIIVAPIMSAYFFSADKVSSVAQILLETLAAQLVTAPIIMVAFGQLSVISLLANLLVGPFIPLAMLLTAIGGVSGLILPAVAHIVGWPAQMMLDTMIAVVNWCAEQSWASVELQIPWWAAVLWYGLIILMVYFMKHRSGYRLRDASIVT